MWQTYVTDITVNARDIILRSLSSKLLVDSGNFTNSCENGEIKIKVEAKEVNILDQERLVFKCLCCLVFTLILKLKPKNKTTAYSSSFKVFLTKGKCSGAFLKCTVNGAISVRPILLPFSCNKKMRTSILEMESHSL